jgi:hypothetical protein
VLIKKLIGGKLVSDMFGKPTQSQSRPLGRFRRYGKLEVLRVLQQEYSILY